MYTPQDSETSLEAIFRSKSMPAWNFTLQKRQYLCMEKSLQTNDFFKYKVRNRRKASWKRKSNQIRSLFVETVINAPPCTQLKFPKYNI